MTRLPDSTEEDPHAVRIRSTWLGELLLQLFHSNRDTHERGGPMKKVFTTTLLGIILSLTLLVSGATAQAQYPGPNQCPVTTPMSGTYSVTRTASTPFCATAKVSYNRTPQGTCLATCRYYASANTAGATLPVQYYWYPDTTNTGYENSDNASAIFEGGVAGSQTPMVRIVDGAGRTVTLTMEPVVVQGDTFTPKPVEIGGSTFLTDRTGLLVFTTLRPLSVYWKSGTMMRKMNRMDCRNAALRCSRYAVPAAPSGPLQIIATAGSPPYTATKMFTYSGPMAGGFKTALRAKRVGRGYRLSGTLQGAIGGPMYQYRGLLRLTYRLRGRTRAIASARPRSRVRAAGVEQIIQIGKVSKRIACTARIRGLNRQGATFYITMRSRVSVSGQIKRQPRTTTKRISLARCR